MMDFSYLAKERSRTQVQPVYSTFLVDVKKYSNLFRMRMMMIKRGKRRRKIKIVRRTGIGNVSARRKETRRRRRRKRK